MGVERERKFLITRKNAFKLIDSGRLIEDKVITQKYISFSPEIRFRQEITVDNTKEKYSTTIKSTSLNNRKEINIPITKEKYLSETKKLGGDFFNTVIKRRTVVTLEGLIFEIDFFNEGLILVEIEFDNIVEMETFVPPSYFGRDVTIEEGYKNRNLINKREEKYVVK